MLEPRERFAKSIIRSSAMVIVTFPAFQIGLILQTWAAVFDRLQTKLKFDYQI